MSALWLILVLCGGIWLLILLVTVAAMVRCIYWTRRLQQANDKLSSANDKLSSARESLLSAEAEAWLRDRNRSL